MKLIFLWICHVDIMSVMRSNAEILQKKRARVHACVSSND